MWHPLNGLLRVGRSRAERDALRGDLEEIYRSQVRPSHSWLAAQAWYTGEVLAALAYGLQTARLPRLGIIRDVRYALRRWRRRPGFAVMATFTLALGIAAATASFSLLDGVVLRPLPWDEPERLVYVHGVYPDRRNNPATAATWNRGALSYPAWDALRTSPAFETVAVWRSIGRLDTTIRDGRDDIVRTAGVSSNFLPMLGVGLTLGRYFTEREDNVNSDSIILTYETWRRRFGARKDVIGHPVSLGRASSGDQQLNTVVGVLAPGFRFDGEPPEILLPVGISAETSRRYSTGGFRVVARLAPGVTREQAEAAAASLVGGTRTTEPISARLSFIEDEHLGTARRPMWLLFGAAGLLLLIACSNVAGLLLGEARARRHEIAVRAALGSGRPRLIRQAAIEHAMLAAIGTALGLAGAYWLIGAAIAAAPEGLPRIGEVGLDARAAMFAALCGIGTFLLFGVGPAVAVVRTPVASTLAEGAPGGGVSRAIGQRVIVVAQLALALVLLTGASLFAETIRRLVSQPLGFDPSEVAVVTTTFTGHRWGDPDKVGAQMRRAPRNDDDFGRFMSRLAREASNARDDQVFERLSALPGVHAVASATAVPFIAADQRLPIVLEARPDAERHDVWRQTVSSRYFEVMGIRLLSGRFFSASDRPADSAAAVVSREFERRFFSDGAVHRRFRQVYGANYELSAHFHVVGVVEDVKRNEFSDDLRPSFYSFDRQLSGATETHFVIRAAGDAGSLLPAVRRAITGVTPQLVVTSSALLEDRVARSVAEERFRAMLSTAFGLGALLLAAVGLYGVVSRRTADRRREFGIRVAFGARPQDVRQLVIREAMVMILCGLAIGLPAAYAAAQLTRSLLFGISPSSLFVFALTSAVLALVALLASILPARRASRLDPVASLRS